jgi:membrane protein DedA with SNARE-associated domain
MLVETLLIQYGYFAVFGTVLFVGEFAVIAAGILAQQGYMRLDIVIAVVTVSAFISDQISFLIGRRLGLPYLEKKRKWQPRISKARRMLDRYRYTFILGFRFITVIHAFMPPVLGAIGYNVRRFTALNAIGAVLWAAINSLAGYFFGHALEKIFDDVNHYELWIIVGLAAAGLAAGIIIAWRRRKARKDNLPSGDLPTQVQDPQCAEIINM